MTVFIVGIFSGVGLLFGSALFINCETHTIREINMCDVGYHCLITFEDGSQSYTSYPEVGGSEQVCK